jgi:WD40 repeat protein
MSNAASTIHALRMNDTHVLMNESEQHVTICVCVGRSSSTTHFFTSFAHYCLVATHARCCTRPRRDYGRNNTHTCWTHRPHRRHDVRTCEHCATYILCLVIHPVIFAFLPQTTQEQCPPRLCTDQLFATTSRDCTTRVWNVSTGECVRVLVGHTNGVLCAAVHGDM